MDKYKLDSHKLIYHVPRVNDWLNNELIYPIYMEISPIGACNHRCVFCGLDFMRYSPKKLDCTMLKERLSEFSDLGVKSIMYAGEGEPFLHKDISEIVVNTKKSDIDVAITSNGVLMKPQITDEILEYCSWIKISINAGTAKTYSKIHRTKEADFYKVIENLKYAVELKHNNNLSCVLGMQIILLPEVEDEVEELANIAKNIGLDYLVVKPYSQHPQSITQKYKDINYSKYDYLDDKLKRFNSDEFSAILRLDTMQRWDDSEKKYEKCLGLPFWSYIDAEGNVWGCSMYLKDEIFLYGNINNNTFKEIWEGERRKKSLEFVENNLSISNCRINCRMDNINKYLWDLKNPIEHVNFI